MPSYRDRLVSGSWPAFRFDEVVRVIDATRGPETDEHIFESEGREGIVRSLMPNRDGGGWEVSVHFGEEIESGHSEDSENFSRHFWEWQLESTGYLAREGVRVPLDPAEHAESFVELRVALFVPISDEPLDHLVSRAKTACAQILPSARIEAAGRVYGLDYPDHWWIWLEIRPAESSRDAFEALVGSSDHWLKQWDNGWTCHFAWYRKAAGPGEQGLLLAEADSVFVDLDPYSDPSYRPVRRGRNEGLGPLEEMMAFLPPPAGYEPLE